MSPFRRTVALLMLVAYVALTTVGVSWVICMEGGGQVEFVLLPFGCCDDVATTDSQETVVDVEYADCPDCDGHLDCDDSLLAGVLLSRRSEDRTDPPHHPAASVPPPTRIRIMDLTPSRTFATAPPPVHCRPPPQLRALATTVLLL